MDKVKATVIAAISALMSWLGILAIPVLLLVGCNIIDYITGLMAAKFREDGGISSYKSIRGIYKKIGMWMLVIVGAFADVLIQYSVECAGIEIAVPFVVATVVAVWLVVNELISILENLKDSGVKIPPFLMPLMKYINRKVEDKAKLPEETQEVTGE